MNAVSRVLVIGGGPVGNALTVLLRRGGIEVDLVEKDPRWAAFGAGITLPHNALRVLQEVGVLDEVLEHGAAEPHTHGVPLPGHDGSSASFVSQTPLVDCGLYRPKLQEILIDAVRASGADVRLGTTAVSLRQSEQSGQPAARHPGSPTMPGATRSRWAFTEGTSRRYDLVVGADGMHSATRSMLGIDMEPTPMGIGAWRIYTPRPPTVRGFKMYRSGPCHVAGIPPTSRDHLYAYLVEDARIPDPPREDRVEVARSCSPATASGRSGGTSASFSPARSRSTVGGSPTSWSSGPGTGVGSSSSGMPPTPTRRLSRRVPPWAWRTPRCSPSS